MTAEPANPFNVQINNEEGEDICVICQEALKLHPTYMLPECHHKFHTHCIVTWFRAQTSEENDVVGGRCPSCGDRGVNCRRRRRRWHSRLYGGDPQFTSQLALMRKESRKEGAPSQLVKLVKQEHEAVEHIKETNEKRKEYEEYLSNHSVNFKEAKDKRRALRREYHNAFRKHGRIQTAIYNFPIVPIIIPTFVDINW
tara:strand:- start:133 stop:726 length:594 start_codon:yes stop_codon:yes gene_type:complete